MKPHGDRHTPVKNRGSDRFMFQVSRTAMTQREQARLQVLNSLLAEHMTPDQAATLMGVSSRHARRILVAYQE